MVYREYKEASIRHLETSLFLVKHLDNIDDAKERKSVLLNIYYLAGYTIECIVNYAIYNYIGFRSIDDVRSLNCQSYPFDTGFKFEYKTKAGIILKPRFVIQSHSFQNNCTFFSSNGITDASKIPHFDTLIHDKNMIPLFNNWKPEVRYIDLGFSEHLIIEFVKLTHEIHHKTRKYITKD